MLQQVPIGDLEGIRQVRVELRQLAVECDRGALRELQHERRREQPGHCADSITRAGVRRLWNAILHGRETDRALVARNTALGNGQGAIDQTLGLQGVEIRVELLGGPRKHIRSARDVDRERQAACDPESSKTKHAARILDGQDALTAVAAVSQRRYLTTCSARALRPTASAPERTTSTISVRSPRSLTNWLTSASDAVSSTTKLSGEGASTRPPARTT